MGGHRDRAIPGASPRRSRSFGRPEPNTVHRGRGIGNQTDRRRGEPVRRPAPDPGRATGSAPAGSRDIWELSSARRKTPCRGDSRGDRRRRPGPQLDGHLHHRKPEARSPSPPSSSPTPTTTATATRRRTNARRAPPPMTPARSSSSTLSPSLREGVPSRSFSPRARRRRSSSQPRPSFPAARRRRGSQPRRNWRRSTSSSRRARSRRYTMNFTKSLKDALKALPKTKSLKLEVTAVRQRARQLELLGQTDREAEGPGHDEVKARRLIRVRRRPAYVARWLRTGC